MTDSKPKWVQDILDKCVVKQTRTALPPLGRNLQAEIGRIQAVIDVVSQKTIPPAEILRLRSKVQDLVNILETIKNPP